MSRTRWPLTLVCLLLATAPAAADGVVHVGAKKFTESQLLGQILAQLASNAGAGATPPRTLGDTVLVWNALLRGDIDAYCEYTGTLTQDILAKENLPDEKALVQALADRGLRMSRPLGFNNTYALGMRTEEADRLGITKISDLIAHPELRFSLSNQFLSRAKDGWEPLRQRYGLPQKRPEGAGHDVALQALAHGQADVTDIYATDAKVEKFKLKVLEDDLHFFPRYDAVVLSRVDLDQRAPDVVKAFHRLEGRISDETMRRLNSRVDLDGASLGATAVDFLADAGLADRNSTVPIYDPGLTHRLLVTTGQHLALVSVSLTLAILVAVPLGVAAVRWRWLGHVILTVVGVVQTIPTVALLVLLLYAGTKIGPQTAILALFLYSLLPIVRNTYAGLSDIPLHIRESAEAMGLSSWARLRLIELPMAARSILAGVKTAAVINVGNATLGGLIAAGGYGQPIFTGLDRNDIPTTLEGAIPAIIMALAVQGLFDLAERVILASALRL